MIALVSLSRGPGPDVAAAALPTGRAVVLESVVPEPGRRVLRMSGTVEARASVELRFDVAGRVAHFFVEEGGAVGEGDPIAALDLQDLERDLELARAVRARASARAQTARSVRERREALHRKESISEQALEEAQLEARVAAAELREAELRVAAAERNLEKGTLRAPMSGHVAQRWVELHEHVEAARAAVQLVDLDPVRVRAAAPDARASLLEPGGRALVRSPAWPRLEFEGRIAQIDLVADPDTHSWPFEVEVANPELRLRPEAVVDVIVEAAPGPPRVTLPLSAVLRDSQEEPFCFVAGNDGARRVAERRGLVIGGVVGERVVIEAGLEPGERVVIEGQHFIRPGDLLVAVED